MRQRTNSRTKRQTSTESRWTNSDSGSSSSSEHSKEDADGEYPYSLSSKVVAEVLEPPPCNRLSFSVKTSLNFGVQVNENLVVNAVPPGSTAYGKLQVGDKVIGINRRKMRSLSMFTQYTRTRISPLTVVVDRPLSTYDVTPYRAKNLGIDLDSAEDIHFIVYIHYSPDISLGLAVKASDRVGVVVVASVSPGSLSEGRFEKGDFILDINGIPIHNKHTVKQLILQSLSEKNYVTAVCRRPVCNRSIELARQALGTSSGSMLDPELPADAAYIGRREALRRNGKAYTDMQISSIIKPPQKNHGTVSFQVGETIEVEESDPGTTKDGE
ncbi:hypothetical protein QR680_019002 [Steinernema hermaphroditum]|uniref:PDZ domain-containing protein n=1 Tax=Steinernema hermaphroditum TaxID=289476 RepID=A0AA39HJP0_9BILA|nr:hypothetical protein QR680_019002 [Steinernema hermaphroditum]